MITAKEKVFVCVCARVQLMVLLYEHFELKETIVSTDSVWALIIQKLNKKLSFIFDINLVPGCSNSTTYTHTYVTADPLESSQGKRNDSFDSKKPL